MLDGLEEFQSIHDGHPDIGENHVGTLGRDGLEGLLPVLGQTRLFEAQIRPTEVVLQSVADDLFVVDDEKPVHGPACLSAGKNEWQWNDRRIVPIYRASIS
jgi:hypothetical protein